MGETRRRKGVFGFLVAGAFLAVLLGGVLLAGVTRSPSDAERRDVLWLAGAEVHGIVRGGVMEVDDRHDQITCAEIGGDFSSSSPSTSFGVVGTDRQRVAALLRRHGWETAPSPADPQVLVGGAHRGEVQVSVAIEGTSPTGVVTVRLTVDGLSRCGPPYPAGHA